MLFSQDKNKGNKPEKKRSILGLLFNPRLDRDIAPMKESASMFIRMLASLFVTTKLFPKNHPAFKNDKVRLTMKEVIGTAYSNLSFTKEGVPQVLYFGAVVGMLGFSVLFLIALLLSFMMGTAQAADPVNSVFISAAGEKDWAVAIVKYLFMAEQIDIGIPGAIPDSSHGIQKALGFALSFYSKAVLVLAGLLLLYHLTFMVAETAHTGKPMGEANQIWAPIRLVFAIGLLVPIASGSNGVAGYNTGQYLGMQVAIWGSGLASNVWGEFLLNINDAPYGCDNSLPAGEQPPSCLTMKGRAEDIIKHMLIVDACAYIYNYQLKQAEIGDKFEVTRGYQVMAKMGATPEPKKYYLDFHAKADAKFFVDSEAAVVCGGYDIPSAPATDHPYYGVYQSQLTLFKTYGDFTRKFAENYAKYYIHNHVEFPDETKAIRETMHTQLVSYISNFQESLDVGARTYMENGDKKTLEKYKDTLIGKTGWLGAGAWFNDITGKSADRADIFYNSLPTIIKPTLYQNTLPTVVEYRIKPWGGEGKTRSKIKTTREDVMEDLARFADVINYEIKIETNDKGMIKGGSDTPNKEAFDFNNITFGTIKDAILSTSTNIFNFVMNGVDSIGASHGLWNKGTNSLGIKFGLKHNPLAELANYGQKNVEVAMKLYTIGGFILAISAIPTLAGAGGLASIFFVIAGLFMIIGFTMGYIVPLYPFFRFLFGSVTWLMSVFELIVAIPLWALAHVNPYGKGLSGDKAKYGYSMLMQVLLRPVLMVFGLVAGYLIFTAAVFFLNNMFIIAAQGTGAFNGSFPIVAKIIYSILYCVIVLILANQCFSTIGLFPQTALSWLGMGQVKEEQMGDAAGKIAAVAAYGSKEMGSQMTQLASAPGKAIQGHLDRKEKKETTAAATTTASRNRWAAYREGMASGALPPGTRPPNVPDPES